MLALRSLYVLWVETISEWLRWYGVLTVKKKETPDSDGIGDGYDETQSERTGEGLHHSEVVVSVHTSGGDEGLVLGNVPLIAVTSKSDIQSARTNFLLGGTS